MRVLDDVYKKPYTRPKLTIHGTLAELTLMRFKWPTPPGQGATGTTNVS
jgi:hypothetical protein